VLRPSVPATDAAKLRTLCLQAKAARRTEGLQLQ
jgi:hypothetical protein